MKLFKEYALMGALCLVASNALRASDDEVSRILAKYGLDKKATTIKKTPTQTSMAGDLATNSIPSKEELQKTAKIGKELEKAVDRVDDKKLDSVVEKTVNSDKEEIEAIKEGIVEEKPGFFSRLFNYVPGLLKITSAVTQFNKKAAENLTRFKETFKNVSDSLVSFNEDRVLRPQKINGEYVLDKETGAIKWELVKNTLTSQQLKALKQECLYVIIKEMVDGFNHLDPIVGNGLNAFSFLAPDTAKQSVLIYEVATKFLPMLEKIARENVDSSIESTK